MTEGKVYWHYKCPFCGKTFEYGIIAGSPTKICKDCYDNIDFTVLEGE